MSKLTEFKAKLLGSNNDAVQKTAGHKGANNTQPSFKQHLPAIIDQYPVSWEFVAGDLSPEIIGRFYQIPNLVQQIKDWETWTQARMQALLDGHVDKYC
jgi:hypothetical protein